VLDRAALAALGVDDTVIARRQQLDGDRALAFLAGLPARVARWQGEWGLGDLRLMAGGALSAVLAGRRLADGRAAMLKLSALDAHSAVAEAAALAAWDGVGACALLAAGEGSTALLLAAIEPGDAVTPSGDDAVDAADAGGLLALLHRPLPTPAGVPDGAGELGWRFGRARRWLDEGRAVAAVAPHELEAAARAAGALHRSGGRALCHGDFLDKNLLLDAGRRWWAIDPLPCIGDPCMDAGFWALHHRPGIAVRDRCDLIAAAGGMDPQRVWRWASAFAAAEAVLDVDGGRAESHLRTLRS
jgi:streptomycin 6-kinase